MNKTHNIDGYSYEVAEDNSFTDKENSFAYNLCDDGGVSTVWDIPFVMAIGSTFKHEFGVYKVESYVKDFVNCERISK